MKTQALLLLITLCIGIAPCLQAQDANMQAIAYYNKAEAAFNNSSYQESLAYLQTAEGLLGSTNSKLLYLKIKNLNLLVKIDNSKLTDLKRAIAQFYQYTDQNKFPEQYLDVTNIDIDLKAKEAVILYKQRKEQQDYDKLKAGGTLSEYSMFFSEYPNSQYAAELKPKFDLLLEQKKAADLKAENQLWKDEQLLLLKKHKRKGTALVASGVPLLAAGIGLLGYGTYYTLNPPKVYEWQYNTTTATFEQVEVGSDGIGGTMIATLVPGSVCALTGLVLTAVGGSKFTIVRKIKRQAVTRGVELSYAPVVLPYSNNYAINLTLKF